MPIVDMKQMLEHAYRNRYAIGAFDVINLDFINGVLAAAENCQSPVILSLAESHFDYFDYALLMPAVEAAAKRAAIPVAIHLDHGMSLETAIRLINLGCNGVMVDASHHPFAENVKLTREVTQMAHGCGIPVEGELGYVPGVEGEDAARHPGELKYTSATEAKTYVEATGVDFLAVSIGTVHGRMQGQAELNFSLLDEINQSLNIPLVLHGGSGLTEEQYGKLISHGISKINYYTALADAAGLQVRHNTEDSNANYTAMMQGTVGVIRTTAENCMRLWGSSGKASDLLRECRPWLPVEHLIIYNTSIDDPSQVNAMMAEGRRVLARLPGVREVVTGNAVKTDATYRHSWVIRFCHPAVIDSYRDHPEHVAFADNHFRPVAGDRISIDYQAIESAET